MIKKILLIGLAVVFLAVPAFAGDRPEFDAVADDSANFFNDFIKDNVVAQNPWNLDSDFTTTAIPAAFRESFVTNAGGGADVCFPGYTSYLTVPRTARSYTWRIVLQMDPQSDLDINIRDCVVKNNATTAFGCAPYDGCEQTGRYTNPDGSIFWSDLINPRVFIRALPGPLAVDGFVAAQQLFGRTQPILALFPYNGVLFTSKCLWEESLVVVMPEFPIAGFALSAGDIIEVKISVPFNNAAFIRYGQDNVVVKYIGVCGTDLTVAEL